MSPSRAGDKWERGTARLLEQMAILERLAREPRRGLTSVLERELGRETAGLALAAAGLGRPSVSIAA